VPLARRYGLGGWRVTARRSRSALHGCSMSPMVPVSNPRVRRAAIRSLAVASSVIRPPYTPVGHYYSPLTSAADVDRAVEWSSDRAIDPIEYSQAHEDHLAKQLAAFWDEMPSGMRYHRDEMYELADAAIYYSMLRLLRPKQIIEIGSGYSTAIALDTIEKFKLDTAITCIEPYANRLRTLMRSGDDVTLIEKPVQQVPLDVFRQLKGGDILFIDSTHVAKPGSDVIYDFLKILPSLTPGVFVHVHDMFWPFEYPESWLRQRRDWNEIYLVRAFLTNNDSWRIRFFGDHAWPLMSEAVASCPALQDALQQRPGALWLERV
jgi:predicted O-methyltransferase YrrM